MSAFRNPRAWASILAGTGVLLVVCAAAWAWPDWYDPVTRFGIKPDIPDFYQSQKDGIDADPNPLVPGYKSGNWWQKVMGWCAPTAFANCMYYWNRHGYDGLYPGGGANWLENMCYAVEDAVIEMKYYDRDKSNFLAGVDSYLNKHGHGPRTALGKNLRKTLYVWDKVNKRVQVCNDKYEPVMNTTYRDMFSLYQAELLGCQDVLVTIEDADGFHCLTGAGVDCKNRKLIYADPATGGPYKPADPFPVGAGHYDTSVVGADGVFTKDGAREGYWIQEIKTICPCEAWCWNKRTGYRYQTQATFKVRRTDPVSDVWIFPDVTVDASQAVEITAADWLYEFVTTDPAGNDFGVTGIHFWGPAFDDTQTTDFTFTTLDAPATRYNVVLYDTGTEDYRFIADIPCEDIPEPAMVSLVVLGGAALLRRCRGLEG